MTPETIPEFVADLRTRPGIDTSKLVRGTTVLVETTQAIYELTLLNSAHSLFQIIGSSPRFHNLLIGQLKGSSYDMAGQVFLPHWIGTSLRLQLAFKNAEHQSTAALSARVSGNGWYFDAF